ncbi:hypothetical protein GQ43DRAFT_429001 [Delitschia confertaspora ATCC 74209]|uniref:Myb-like DNA-binding domain protein n=1 Tax=Delitschia confertaspora ATCC 74209 TaxID=1513339 RepID=A0A9P4JU02_9PLEO|nr:hypothetical protein GQ43DRAFT_429001 [Delitschia confertaspora ATCC 74209]
MGRERRKWTPEEDELLRHAVKKAMERSQPLLWRELAKKVPGRTNKDCRRRWWNSLAEGMMKGPWTESEDERLFNAVREHGTKWNRIAAAVRTRNSDQCSSHWSQTLDPNINYSDWTKDEDERLLHAVDQYGTNWIRIASTHALNRTTLALKNRYSTLRSRSRTNSFTMKSTSTAEPRFGSSGETRRQAHSHFDNATSMDADQRESGDQSDDENDSDDEPDDLDEEVVDSSMFMGMEGFGTLPLSTDNHQGRTSSNQVPQYFTPSTSSIDRWTDNGMNPLGYSTAYPFDFGLGGQADDSQIGVSGHAGAPLDPFSFKDTRHGLPSHPSSNGLTKDLQYVSSEERGPMMQDLTLQSQLPRDGGSPGASSPSGQGFNMVGTFPLPADQTLHRVQIDAECTSENLGSILRTFVGVAKSVTVKVEQ